ncbi:DUF3152 domain-containing protein [Streptomyces sp. MMBL 11-3]|uniref:DUF3152 domain-containing protein n=1 Tax=Streptomyces sp. MMBL 11-3 TaxID=3382639 RepID=UPI0039B49947
MGRHSRRGPAPKGGTVDKPAVPAARSETGAAGAATGRRAPAGQQPPSPPTGGAPRYDGGAPGNGGHPYPGPPDQFPGRRPDGYAAYGDRPSGPSPRLPDGTPAHGFPRLQDGTPAHGFPRLPDGTPAHGFPRLPDGTPAHGFPRLPDGARAQGGPRPAGGTPTPTQGAPRVRGGHPEQREAGGGWGRTGAGAGTSFGTGFGAGVAAGAGAGAGSGAAYGTPRTSPRSPQGPRPDTARARGPRQAYVDAFDDAFDDGGGGSARPAAFSASAPVADRDGGTEHKAPPRKPGGTPATTADRAEGGGGGGKGRTFTGIAAAAVTTVLAVVVAGQVTDGDTDDTARPAATGGAGQRADDYASRTDKRPAPSVRPGAATLSYTQQMAAKYPLAAGLEGGGKFEAIPGLDKAPGKGQKYTYRVDVEKDLGLDGRLFAQAVQKTLNDKRSWAHGGGRTFERISSGKPDFVITLASPGTTAFWCAKSGLDTTQDNVSCDSAATDRVMINAYRWAQGSKTYGDKMYAYRQMLINHEVGHRLGYGHVSCSVDGGLAPVMQQQTKFLDHDGISCKPNPWPFPSS